MPLQYRCRYVFGRNRIKRATAESEILNFRKGFWVKDDFDFATTEEEKRYWIPKHKVLFVERIKT